MFKKFSIGLLFCINFGLQSNWDDKVLFFYETLNLDGKESKKLEDLYIKYYMMCLESCKEIIESKSANKVEKLTREEAFCELMASWEATKRAVREFKAKK